MEEIRETAKTYYKNVPKNVTKAVDKFFKEMDDNGDGKISLHEFAAMMSEEGYEAMNNQSFFDQINEDKSGFLDFDDVITLFYIITCGRPLCGGCRKLIEGSYFGCVKCFDENNSFSLHRECFDRKKYIHKGHAQFLDSHALLQRSQRGLVGANKNLLKAHSFSSSSSTSLAIVPAAKMSKRRAAFKALETAIGAGNIASNLCTIM